MAKQPQLLRDGAVYNMKNSWRREQAGHALPCLGQDTAPWQPQESGSRRGTRLLILGLSGCDIGESLSPLLVGLGRGSSIKMTWQNLDSGLRVSGSFLALSYDSILQGPLVQALSEL